MTHHITFWRMIAPVAIFGLLSSASAPAQVARSVSPTRQFIIYGADATVRGAVSDVAEETKRNLLSLLRTSDEWQTPVVINLETPAPNLPEIPKSRLQFSQTGAGLKLQLDFVVSDEVEAADLQRQVLRALLLERMYRQRPDIAPGTPYVEPPAWLLEGLLALTSRQPAANDAAIDSLGDLETFLHAHPAESDAAAAQIYRFGATALVRILDGGVGGPQRLAAYIDKLPEASEDALADLRMMFPDLGANDLDQRWHEEMRSAGLGHEGFKLSTFTETEEELRTAMAIHVGEKEFRLEDLAKPKLSNLQKASVKAAAQRLMVIGATANPLLRPLIGQYQQIAQLLVKGKWKGQSARLEDLRDTERRLASRMSDIDDYMNWFEATQPTILSGVFREYLRTASVRDEAPRRRDAMSVYLDSMEMQLNQ